MPLNRRIFINSLPEIGRPGGMIAVMYPTLFYLEQSKSIKPKVNLVKVG